MPTILAQSLASNFDYALDVLQAALTDCPDDLWSTDLWPDEAPTQPFGDGAIRGSAPWLLAHHALSLLYRPRQPATRVYCYDLEALDQEVHGRGTNRVAVGRLRARSRTTWDCAETNFVVIHYGGLDFYTVLRKERSPREYEEFKKRLSSGELLDDIWSGRKLLKVYRQMKMYNDPKFNPFLYGARLRAG